jgi:hypothetical protein
MVSNHIILFETIPCIVWYDALMVWCTNGLMYSNQWCERTQNGSVTSQIAVFCWRLNFRFVVLIHCMIYRSTSLNICR